jgi:hypothetical protein
VLVGLDPQQEFTVYHDIVAARSGFFRRMERCTKDNSTPMVLDGHDPGNFDRYLHCIYHGEAPEFIQPPADKDHPYTIPSRHEIEPVQNRLDQDFESLLKLYALADSLSDPTTANMAFEEIRKLCQSSCFNLGAGFVDLAFRSTKQGDGLRNFLADQYVYESDCLPRGNFPAAFFKLIVERFLSEKSCNIVKVDDAHVRMINGPEVSDWRRREYHQIVEQRPEGYNGTLKPERD